MLKDIIIAYMERNHSLKITNGGHQWGTLKKLQVPQRKKERKKQILEQSLQGVNDMTNCTKTSYLAQFKPTEKEKILSG